MEPKILLQPFELVISDVDCWNKQPLIYHFFEIVQILEGDGVRIVNHNKLPYKKGSIFLFTPLDCRGFDTTTPTQFCSIRFSGAFLGQCKSLQERERIARWLKQLEYIFFHQNRFHELLIKQPGDCRRIDMLIKNMVEEYEQRQAYYEENIQHYLTLILNILTRNVSENTEMATYSIESEPLINKILIHIHQFINYPEKLRINFLASHFHLSKNYIGEYFRKFTGESLQNFIIQYRIRLVQQRLTNSTLTVSQISDELGFTDESHLNRQFRKYVGLSPKKYRKNTQK